MEEKLSNWEEMPMNQPPIIGVEENASIWSRGSIPFVCFPAHRGKTAKDLLSPNSIWRKIVCFQFFPDSWMNWRH